MAPREKATDPYVNTTGSLTLLSQLEKRMDLHVSSEARPDFLRKPQRNPEIHVGTGEEPWGSGFYPVEDLGPGSDYRGILRGPSQLAWRLDFPESPQAGP